jgi:hypothetical protein
MEESNNIMKLHELKAAGAFTTSMKKMAANLSLGDIKEALRNSDTKKFDAELVKKVAFASSFRRHEDNIAGDTMSCTLEIPNVGMVAIIFKMKGGQVTVASLEAAPEPKAPKEEKPDAAK